MSDEIRFDGVVTEHYNNLQVLVWGENNISTIMLHPPINHKFIRRDEVEIIVRKKLLKPIEV